MKKGIHLLVMILAIGFSAVTASANDVFPGCVTGISGDAGVSLKRGQATGAFDTCKCSGMMISLGYCNYYVDSVDRICNGGYTTYGYLQSGNACCYDASEMCSADQVAAVKQAIQAEESLAEVFNTYEGRPAAYWGYENTNLRSPLNGRANAYHAKLDACVGHANADAASSYPSCLTTCNDGAKNPHCGDNNAAVCIDRCECYWSQGTCNNL